MKSVLVLFGTRPEAIKLAPVIRELHRYHDEFVCRVCCTGQHREMVEHVLDAFGLNLDFQFDAMSSAQSLGLLTGRLFYEVDRLLEAEKPDWLIVQGDTTSAMVSAVSAFYRHVAVGHVEAGLRTGRPLSPFPEEINRTFIGHVADLHFAPTYAAAENLRKAGVREETIHITGNTVVDALQWASERVRNGRGAEVASALATFIENKRLVLVTSHRRESFGRGLENICRALLQTVERHKDVVIVYPVHLNPNVKGPVHRLLGSHPRIKLIEPVRYLDLVWLMQHSYCIFTDSGGIQEEAPSLGKPVLIMRETTERPEVIECGSAPIVGCATDGIVAGACQLLEDPVTYEEMSQVRNPFGDGKASKRIVSVLRSPEKYRLDQKSCNELLTS